MPLSASGIGALRTLDCLENLLLLSRAFQTLPCGEQHSIPHAERYLNGVEASSVSSEYDCELEQFALLTQYSGKKEGPVTWK